MRVDWLAIIPARFGSQGISRKNIQPLGGIPLVQHTIEYAQKHFQNILLTTDDEEVLNIYLDLLRKSVSWNNVTVDQVVRIGDGVYVHKRAKEDADTLSPIAKVLYKMSVNPIFEKIEKVVLLQPTSPFRGKSDLEQLASLADKLDWTSIFSVKDVGANHPNRMYRIDEKGQAFPIDVQESQDNVARQLLGKVYIKDGAFYLFKKDNLAKKKLIGERPLCFQRHSEYNVNIDTESDLILANYLWERR